MIIIAYFRVVRCSVCQSCCYTTLVLSRMLADTSRWTSALYTAPRPETHSTPIPQYIALPTSSFTSFSSLSILSYTGPYCGSFWGVRSTEYLFTIQRASVHFWYNLNIQISILFLFSLPHNYALGKEYVYHVQPALYLRNNFDAWLETVKIWQIN